MLFNLASIHLYSIIALFCILYDNGNIGRISDVDLKYDSLCHAVISKAGWWSFTEFLV
jgi:hypothetical protein